ncbi:MAG: SMC-Scp complex subunit ScpB [Rhodospirillaceae bacterium]|nr:SMC-Scp complex subunit ScpB [Rhodospirillaceae bacterium]
MTVSDAASESDVVELVNDNDEGDVTAIEENLRLVEALLFASASAVTEKMIIERLGDGVDVPRLLSKIKEMYKGRGVELTRAGNRWYFRTAPDLGDRLKLEKMVPRKLSRAGTETLAIIAYHQPVTRAEIEEIRGVVISKGTIDILLEEGWIKPRGRRHTPGRPMTWGTSESFLDHFGLESLNDLPGIDELKAAGLLDSRQGLAAYNARAEQGETLLFDTDDSDEALEPLEDGEATEAEEPTVEAAEETPEPEGQNPEPIKDTGEESGDEDDDSKEEV